jgi:hypothetical protein
MGFASFSIRNPPTVLKYSVDPSKHVSRANQMSMQSKVERRCVSVPDMNCDNGSEPAHGARTGMGRVWSWSVVADRAPGTPVRTRQGSLARPAC